MPVGQAAVPTVPSTSSTTVPAVANAASAATTTTLPRIKNAALPPSSATTVPNAPNAEPGQASLLVDGQTIDATITRSNDQLLVTAGDMTATISGRTADGTIAPLDADGNIHLSEGDSIALSAQGFGAGSDVEVWLFSTPTRLGTAHVNANGTVEASFKLPGGVPNGQHRLVLVGKNANKADTTFAVGLVYGKSGGVGTLGKVLIVTPLTLAILAALALPARRRRKNAVA